MSIFFKDRTPDRLSMFHAPTPTHILVPLSEHSVFKKDYVLLTEKIGVRNMERV